MAFRHAILGLLADGPQHGYDLKAVLEAELAPDDALNVGQVYTALDRLHRDGSVSQEEVSQAERPDKKVYKLTPGGRRELNEWLLSPSEIDLDLRNEIYMKLMVARRRGRPSPAQVIAVERKACMARLHELGRARLAAGSAASPGARMLMELAVLRLEALTTWLDRCEAILRQESTS